MHVRCAKVCGLYIDLMLNLLLYPLSKYLHIMDHQTLSLRQLHPWTQRNREMVPRPMSLEMSSCARKQMPKKQARGKERRRWKRERRERKERKERMDRKGGRKAEAVDWPLFVQPAQKKKRKVAPNDEDDAKVEDETIPPAEDDAKPATATSSKGRKIKVPTGSSGDKKPVHKKPKAKAKAKSKAKGRGQARGQGQGKGKGKSQIEIQKESERRWSWTGEKCHDVWFKVFRGAM